MRITITPTAESATERRPGPSVSWEVPYDDVEPGELAEGVCGLLLTLGMRQSAFTVAQLARAAGFPAGMVNALVEAEE